MNLNATLFVQFVVFIVLAIFTAKVVWPPLMKVLDERTQKIAEGLAAAERSKQEVAAVEKRVMVELSNAREEAQKRVSNAENLAQQVAEEIRQNAYAEAAQIIEEARTSADLYVKRARDELRGEVAVLAVKGAEQILKREVNASVHAEMLNQLSSEL